MESIRFLILVLTFLFSSGAYSTTFDPNINMQDAIQIAEPDIIAHVRALRVTYGEHDSKVHTCTEFEVLETVLGHHDTAENLTICNRGGYFRGRFRVIPGMPSFIEGAEYIVSAKDHSYWPYVGGEKLTYNVINGKIHAHSGNRPIVDLDERGKSIEAETAVIDHAPRAIKPVSGTASALAISQTVSAQDSALAMRKEEFIRQLKTLVPKHMSAAPIPTTTKLNKKLNTFFRKKSR